MIGDIRKNRAKGKLGSIEINGVGNKLIKRVLGLFQKG